MALARVKPPMRRSVECVALDLPKPISVNALKRYKDGQRPYDSDKYTSWKKEVGLLINAQRAGGVHGPYALTVTVTHQWRGDLDNALKALGDALQHNGVIENDRLAQEIHIRRSEATAGMSVLVVSTKQKEAA